MKREIWRWVAIPFVVIAVLLIVYWVGLLIGNWSLYRIGIDSEVWKVVFVKIPANALAGGASVYIGAKTAPSKQTETSLVIMIVMLCVSSVSLFIINFITKDYLLNVGIISAMVGIIIGYIYIKSENQ